MNLSVLIIAFNRPDLFSKLLAKVVSVNPTQIYISIDGPREDREGERKRVEEVIAIAKQNSLSSKIILKINEKNLGCAEGVSSAISWFFQNEEKGIILEDDCYPNESFFAYCELLLNMYENDNRIGMISGNNFFFSQYSIKESYYFSKYFHIWGWASWRRAWEGYELRTFDKVEIENTVNSIFKSKKERAFWVKQITNAFMGTIDTWDYQWVYMNFRKKRLSIMPKINLISNQGFGEFATHTVESESILSSMAIGELSFPLIHPKKVVAEEFTEYFSRRLMFRLPFFERLFYYSLRHIFNFFSRLGIR
ncbi:hypothetical protein ND861_10920 [Leptospira sp. 2 VSF19]|uniref:Glycosyltransferase family 2 protein n=1 Tax=Leptospira soteropolitanensis TaxID=2950025 RepID=A0AAW5VD04_9LEPT|nr:hypothetical protein [Leptospira soteropolitanensis]MCW7493186.1 hypothetical protein [Leptospira soteropolitanensis]MCW7500745.1 hypothetical protein [Leptospira soteropolitanensis]MCW7523036.1 hypothetical protein [Leptospira soteropolitanensis]MCW7526857.1 hypothetical protein [Leptospira soteropolitanensis]MCW7530754.1 hypothetical protein [Leptospira soteropolitanensis]